MSQLITQALSNTAPSSDDADSKAAKASAAAIDAAGKYLCNPMEMQNAEQHKVLKLETDGVDPAPILIIDEFYCDTEENKIFIRTLLRDAAGNGIIVFLMTRDRDWASELIKLNGGTKCKPLPGNVDNKGYDGVDRFKGTPEWNDMDWTVDELRHLVQKACTEFNFQPETVIPDHSKLRPGAAKREVLNMRLNQQLKRK